MGIGYVIEHYIAFFKKEQREEAFQNYIADAMRIITENTAKQYGGQYLTLRFADIVEPKKEETRTAEEVITDIKEKLRHI